jgi:hypothetical protein
LEDTSNVPEETSNEKIGSAILGYRQARTRLEDERSEAEKHSLIESL